MSYEIDSLRNQQINSLNAMKAAEAERLKKQTENQIVQLNAQRPQLEQRFTDQAQQAYVQKKLSEKNLPQQMAASGYNGGLSESSKVALDSRYGNSYNSLQRDYNSNLDNLGRQVDNVQFAGDDALRANENNYAGMINEANVNYNKMLQQARAEEQARAFQRQIMEAQFAQQQAMAMADRNAQMQMAQAQREAQEKQSELDWKQKFEFEAYKNSLKGYSGGSGGTSSATGYTKEEQKIINKATKPDVNKVASVYNSMQGWIANDYSMRYLSKDQQMLKIKRQIENMNFNTATKEAIMNKFGYTMS